MGGVSAKGVSGVWRARRYRSQFSKARVIAREDCGAVLLSSTCGRAGLRETVNPAILPPAERSRRKALVVDAEHLHKANTVPRDTR